MNAPEPRIRVLVAHDQEIYRRGLVSAVSERVELELVGESDSGDDAMDKLWRLQPDVTLVDLAMPDLDVLTSIDRSELPTRVVVLSTRTDSEIAQAAIQAGAKAYLSREATPEQLCDAILAVARGETVLPSDLDDETATELYERSIEARLTSREREVLQLAASGYSPYDVARRLYLSSSTLAVYVKGLCEKMGVTEVEEAIVVARKRGILR